MKILAFDNHGNWIDVSGGVTLMSVTDEDYEDAIEELRWRHPMTDSTSKGRGTPLGTAEQYCLDTPVLEFRAMDYESQTDFTYRRV